MRLDWFRVRVLISAVATALLVLGLRGGHGPGPEVRVAPPWPAPASVTAGVQAAGLPLLTPHLQIAVTYRPDPGPVPSAYAFPVGT